MQINIDAPAELGEKLSEARSLARAAVKSDWPNLEPGRQDLLAELALLAVAVAEGHVKSVRLDYEVEG